MKRPNIARYDQTITATTPAQQACQHRWYFVARKRMTWHYECSECAAHRTDTAVFGNVRTTHRRLP